MTKVLDKVGNRYRLCVMSGLNGWVKERTRMDITGELRVPGENENEFVYVIVLQAQLHELVHKGV